jgi:type IV pilus assembly protein PilC
MPDFSYTAVDEFGRRVQGTTSADSETTLAGLLRARGQHLVSAETAKAAAPGLSEIRVLERITRRDVIFFTSQLAAIMGTGVPLVEGLQDIEDQIAKPTMRRVVSRVRQDIESGVSLSDALARHPRVFSELYTNVVKAGEATGRADRSLEDLVKQLEWQESLRAQVRDVFTYPLIVVALLTVVTTVLVGFTIPRFLQVYERLQVQIDLPLPTLIVMRVTGFLRANWLAILAGIAAIYIAIQLQLQTLDGRARIQGWILRIPIIGELVRKIALSRFAHYFATLHESGLEVAPSMSLVERLIGNEYLARRFHRAVDRVMSGESLSHALKAVGEFPAIVIQMIAIGERTGRMSKALEDVRSYYDKEIDRTVKQTLTFVGPILLILLAGVFVTMAVAFYLPMFRVLRAIR